MSAIILAGGKSIRMGCDKTQLILGGRTLIDNVISKLIPVFSELIICGPTNALSVNEGIKYVNDIFSGKGPAGGLYTGLYHSSMEVNFVTACDIPEINTNIIKYMECKLGNYDASVIKVNGFVEPLFGFYKKRILSLLKNNIENGIYKITDLFKQIDVRFITDEELKEIEPEFKGLLNINTPEDYMKYINQESQG